MRSLRRETAKRAESDSQILRSPDAPAPLSSDRHSPEVTTSPRVARTGPVVDYGVAPLVVGDDPTEIIDFVEPANGPGAEPTEELIFEPGGSDPTTAAAQPARRGIFRRTLGGTAWLIRSLFGIASLILLLAIIAAVPIVNLLALGYLLEVEGRLARSGKLRDAFPLIELAPRLGSIALGLTLWLFPLRILSSAAADARLIDAGSRSDRLLHLAVPVLSCLIAIHLCLALARGGGLGTFLRPIKNFRWLRARLREGNYWSQAQQAIGQFFKGLQLKHHFWLGLRGYVGAMLWLAIPSALFAATNKTEGGPILITLLGGLLLMLVLSWVPFLQAHFAAENRFGAMFELKKVRALYKNAPFSWLITMLVTLTLALPMYLFKIVLPPSDAMWLVTVVFIVSIYPVKVLTGWAYHRAVGRERRAFFGLRWLSRLVMVPLLALFVFLLFFTQFIGEHGKGVLFEHHAFLLPAPF